MLIVLVVLTGLPIAAAILAAVFGAVSLRRWFVRRADESRGGHLSA